MRMRHDERIDYFLIGSQKAGTTTLYDWLSQHPNISAPKATKDLHFFSKKANLEGKRIRWLHNMYREGHHVHKLDGSVNYLCQYDVPQRIHEYNADAKLLVVLRDPVKRAFSAYQYFKKLGKEKRLFPDAIRMELESNSYSVWDDKSNFAYIEHGFYYEQLQRWRKYFKPEQFCILIYEEFFQAPTLYLPTIFKFLEIDQSFKPIFSKKNQSSVPKFKWLNSMVYGEGKVRNVLLRKLKLKHLFPQTWRLYLLNNLRDWNTKEGNAVEKLREKDYHWISEIFEDDKRQLSDLLKKDLSELWTFK